MRKFLSRILCVITLGALAPSVMLAQEAPEYTGSVFDGLTEVALDGSLFFGLIVVIAVLVTGFFLGRKWLRSVG